MAGTRPQESPETYLGCLLELLALSRPLELKVKSQLHSTWPGLIFSALCECKSFPAVVDLASSLSAFILAADVGLAEDALIHNLFSGFPHTSFLAALAWWNVWRYEHVTFQNRHVSMWLAFLEIPSHLAGTLDGRGRLVWLLGKALPLLDTSAQASVMDKLFPPGQPLTENLLALSGLRLQKLPIQLQLICKNRIIKPAIEQFKHGGSWSARSLALQVLAAFTFEPETFYTKTEQDQLIEVIETAFKEASRQDVLGTESWILLAVQFQLLLPPRLMASLFSNFSQLIKEQPACKFGVLRFLLSSHTGSWNEAAIRLHLSCPGRSRRFCLTYFWTSTNLFVSTPWRLSSTWAVCPL